MKKLLLMVAAGCTCVAGAGTVEVKIDANKIVAKADRGKLLGVNIAVYNQPEEFTNAMGGLIADLDSSLVRMPGGSVSDKYYWNGNGVIVDGVADPSKYKEGYWQVDYSAYAPGFAVDNHDWSKADPGFINIDAKTMHEGTRKHPAARNMVTINMGTGTAELAAEWVRWANISNDYDVTYWEMGNELNGEWEAGHIMLDGSKMTAEKYVERYIEFAKAMKAVDPDIKIGGPACDVEHHDDYFEPLLRDAGEYVDFITLHYYSLRNSLAPEKELFDGLENLPPIMARMNELIEKYQPARKDEIEISITEWNSKLPKDQDAYRLFNGLWFSAWVGEMLKNGVDSATVWDMFSAEDQGHGLLVRQGDEYVPNGRYWAFWLWSHCMEDALVETLPGENEDLHVYATRKDDRLCVMVMNESRTESYPLTFDVEGFKLPKTARETTLSSREYFWNPYAFTAEWNSGPSAQTIAVSSSWRPVVPPYSVKVYEFGAAPAPAAPESAPGAPELRLLLPENGFADLPVEGWVRVFKAGTDEPYAGDLGQVRLSVAGPAAMNASEVILSGSAAKFMLQPSSAGMANIRAECGDLEAETLVHFNAVEFEERVDWDFESDTTSMESCFEHAVEIESGTSNRVVRITIPDVAVQPPKNHVFALTSYPKGLPKERIGGVVFDVFIPEKEGFDDPAANLQPILQSHGAYWIPCGQIQLEDSLGEWRTVKLEVADKNVLKVMDQAFALRFIMSSEKPLAGNVLLDNIGFLLRPE